MLSYLRDIQIFFLVEINRFIYLFFKYLGVPLSVLETVLCDENLDMPRM